MTKPKVESITIVPAKYLSSIERAKNKVSEDDFVELRVVRNSPKKLEIKKIAKEVKPTEGFRKAIANAELLDESFI